MFLIVTGTSDDEKSGVYVWDVVMIGEDMLQSQGKWNIFISWIPSYIAQSSSTSAHLYGSD